MRMKNKNTLRRVRATENVCSFRCAAFAPDSWFFCCLRFPFPLYLGRLVEFFLLRSAVQLVEHHSIWALGCRCRLAVSCRADAAALGRLQLGEQTPAGRKERGDAQKDYTYNIVIAAAARVPPSRAPSQHMLCGKLQGRRELWMFSEQFSPLFPHLCHNLYPQLPSITLSWVLTFF